MTSKLIWILTFSLALFSCNGQNRAIPPAITTAEPISIHRFDQALFQWIEQGDSTHSIELSQQYPQMLEILGKGVLNLQSPAQPEFYSKLKAYYTEPTLHKLYADALHQYEEIASIEQSLGNGFAWLKRCFPSLQIPAVYMHVSGFNQNILVADSLLSISIDKYLGENYPLYQEFFYDFQRRLMTPAQIVSDYLTGWLLSEFPFDGKENVLLDRMIYEGKIKFILQHAFPEMSVEQLMGYTSQERTWCQENESKLWKTIIERKHLFTPDQLTTARYFESTPSTFIAHEAPGQLGCWMGWQIVNHYMQETQSSIEELMHCTNSQEILTKSKYRP